MALQSWGQTLIAAESDGAALTASTTPTSILNGQAKYTLPSQFLSIGSVLRIRAGGRVSNIVTTPGTLTLDVRFGSVIVANGGAMQLNAVAKTNVTWDLEMMLTCRAVGSSTTANFMWTGMWRSESVVGSALPASGGTGQFILPASAPAVGTGFDSTAAQTVDLFGTWSLNNANSIQTHWYTLESLN